MDLKDSISIVAQSENGLFSDTGIQYFANDVVGINPHLGLMMLSRSDNEGLQSKAYKSIEIMMDDMQLNLTAKITKSRFSGSLASRCLSESLDNINEYLCFQSPSTAPSDVNKGVDLSAIQIEKNSFSSCSIGNLRCLHFSGNELKILATSSPAQKKLGIDTSFKPNVVELEFAEGDIVMLLSAALIKDLGLDFIRVTLSRFKENLEMIIRQINTRALQNGLKQKPVMIICYKDKAIVERRNWFNKLRN